MSRVGSSRVSSVGIQPSFYLVVPIWGALCLSLLSASYSVCVALVTRRCERWGQDLASKASRWNVVSSSSPSCPSRILSTEAHPSRFLPAGFFSGYAPSNRSSVSASVRKSNCNYSRTFECDHLDNLTSLRKRPLFSRPVLVFLCLNHLDRETTLLIWPPLAHPKSGPIIKVPLYM